MCCSGGHSASTTILPPCRIAWTGKQVADADAVVDVGVGTPPDGTAPQSLGVWQVLVGGARGGDKAAVRPPSELGFHTVTAACVPVVLPAPEAQAVDSAAADRRTANSPCNNAISDSNPARCVSRSRSCSCSSCWRSLRKPPCSELEEDALQHSSGPGVALLACCTGRIEQARPFPSLSTGVEPDEL